MPQLREDKLSLGKSKYFVQALLLLLISSSVKALTNKNITCDDNRLLGKDGKRANCSSNSHSKQIQSGGRLDPYGSWNNFLGHSSSQRNSKRGNKNKSKQNKQSFTKSSRAQPCPPGPPGPPGPRGPAGAIVTESRMMMEFRNLVRESAQKRSRRLADNISLMASGIPDLLTAFHVELKHDVHIAKKTLHELSNYKNHVGNFGTFVRGNDIDQKSGRYMARYTGIYQFSCSVHIMRARDAHLRPRDNIKISICINSLCDLNTSLLAITGLNSNSKLFTTSVHGILALKAGQYVSVFAENSSANPITVNRKSSFTGILIGA